VFSGHIQYHRGEMQCRRKLLNTINALPITTQTLHGITPKRPNIMRAATTKKRRIMRTRRGRTLFTRMSTPITRQSPMLMITEKSDLSSIG
jgi:ribosomal protein L34E